MTVSNEYVYHNHKKLLEELTVKVQQATNDIKNEHEWKIEEYNKKKTDLTNKFIRAKIQN